MVTACIWAFFSYMVAPTFKGRMGDEVAKKDHERLREALRVAISKNEALETALSVAKLATYQSKKGDTVEGVASHLNLSPDKLAVFNSLSKGEVITENSILLYPIALPSGSGGGGRSSTKLAVDPETGMPMQERTWTVKRKERENEGLEPNRPPEENRAALREDRPAKRDVSRDP